MPQYISAKEFRRRFPDIVKEIKQAGEIVVLKRSKPIFKIVPFEEIPSDLLDRASTVQDNSQPDLQEISRIVHDLRRLE